MVGGSANIEGNLGGPRGGDKLVGGNGPDCVFGGTGGDILHGGDGCDLIGLFCSEFILDTGNHIIAGFNRNARLERNIISCDGDRVHADRLDRIADDCEKVFRDFQVARLDGEPSTRKWAL